MLRSLSSETRVSTRKRKGAAASSSATTIAARVSGWGISSLADVRRRPLELPLDAGAVGHAQLLDDGGGQRGVQAVAAGLLVEPVRRRLPLVGPGLRDPREP